MNVAFKYNLSYELKEYLDLLIHYKDNLNLRSVIWNPLYTINFLINKKNIINKATTIWKPLEKEVTEAFKKLDLELPKENITCYVHSIGCEGWYNVDKNHIQVRLSKCGDGEFAGAIIHELVHLATWKEGNDYMERENIADNYISKKPLLDIVTKIGDTPQSIV